MTIIKDKIKQYHRKKSQFQLIGGLLNLVVLFFVIWCSTVFLDMAFYFSVSTRWFVLIVNGGLSLFLFYRFFLLHVFSFYKTAKSENYINLTNEIGLNYQDVEDKLTNIYQLENLSVPKESNLGWLYQGMSL